MAPAPQDRHPLAAACDPRTGSRPLARWGPIVVLGAAVIVGLGVAFGVAEIPAGGPARALLLGLLGAAGYFVRAMADRAHTENPK